MFKPKRMHMGKAIFTSYQIGQYGLPEENGWLDEYLVVEDEEDSHPRISTFLTARDYDLIPQKEPHRYCRISRFKGVLNHLMGLGGLTTRKSLDVLADIVEDLPVNIRYTPACLIWETIWKVLRRNKLAKYYSRIPTIIKTLNLADNCTKTGNQIGIFIKVMDDFRELNSVFNEVKKQMSRQYFPNLRFIALMLLKRHGYESPIKIPYARTNLKIDRLHHDYELLWNTLRKQEDESINDFFDF
jgi:hypothetical protein